MAKQALIFGASGITGWAVARECLTYPTPDTFSRVVALTSRPLAKAEFAISDDDNVSKLEVFSGIDLTQAAESVVASLKKIPAIDQITHVYFAAYAGHGDDKQKLLAINVLILSNAVQAIQQLSPNLEFVTLQTGGKAYGAEYWDKPGIMPFSLPFKESQPRAPEPYASNIFYYAQVDALKSLAAGQKWKWCEIRPDMIVGFTPRSNFMGFAQSLALWLSLVRSLEGEGSEVVFPGNPHSWTHKHTDTSQGVLSRFTVFASLKGEEADGRAFNIGDQQVTWDALWPKLTGYFGLKGVGPHTGAGAAAGEQKATGAEWVMSKRELWAGWERENGLKEGFLASSGWEFMAVMCQIPFDRQYDLSAAAGLGFQEAGKSDIADAYKEAFDLMREKKVIP